MHSPELRTALPLCDEIGDSYVLTENPENYSDRVGNQYDCFVAPGIGSSYAFEGDDNYILDVSKIEKS